MSPSTTGGGSGALYLIAPPKAVVRKHEFTIRMQQVDEVYP